MENEYKNPQHENNFDYYYPGINVNLWLAYRFLQRQINNPLDDNAQILYKKLMDDLPKIKRDKILLDEKITKLINKINTTTERNKKLK